MFFLLENLNEALQNILPHGATYCDWIKSGLTLTRMYTEYVNVCQQLTVTDKEKEQLQEQIQSLLEVKYHFFFVWLHYMIDQREIASENISFYDIFIRRSRLFV